MDDSWSSRASRPPPRRPPAHDAPAVDWSPAYQLPYDEQPDWPHHHQQHSQQPSYYASLFSAYRDDPATTNPPSPTSPNTRDYRGSDFATTSASTFSSPGGSWEQWPPDQPAAAAAGPAASTWNALQNELSMLQQFAPNNVPPPPPSVPFYGMRTPPPTGRVPPAEGAFPLRAHDSSQQVWTQPWSMPGGGGGLAFQPNSLEQALPQPPPPPQQRTRYSIAGVILDEDDFLDYATSSFDWLDSAAAVNAAADQTQARAQQQQVPSSSLLPRLDLNYPIMETKPVSPTMYMQLLSPLEPTRPASAPPEKSRRPRPSATGHSGAIEHEDGDVFYQITNRRRSSSVDATMARAAAASSRTNADPLPVEERPSSSYSRPAPHQHHRSSMRGWVHYERRSSMASLEDPNPSSAAYLSSVPYPPPRPGTPTRPSPAARQARGASAAAAASSSSSRHSSAAFTESGSPNTSPSRTGGAAGRHQHRPSSLSFVNFSSADAPRLMKAVSKSGGVAKHKRGLPPESRKGENPHL